MGLGIFYIICLVPINNPIKTQLLVLIGSNRVNTQLTHLLNRLVWMDNKWLDFGGLMGLSRFCHSF